MVGTRVVELRDKRILEVNLQGLAHNASLSNPNCLSIVLNKLKDHLDVDELILKKNHNSFYSKKDVKVLKDLVSKGFFEGDPLKAYLKGNDKLKNSLVVKRAGDFDENNYRVAYHRVFSPVILPSFIDSYVELEEKGKVVEEYVVENSTIRILDCEEGYDYFVKFPETSLGSDGLKRITSFLEKLEEMNVDIELSKNRDKLLSFIKKKLPSKKELLAKIILRHSFGYGLIEVILSDPRIQDVYVDSPGKTPVYVLHQDYGECETNITLSENDLKRLSTRLRVVSGRPFGESNPVIDATLPEFNTRVCGVQAPLTFEGVGFAFRKHRATPWTITKLLNEGLLNPEAAGLLSYLVDAQVSILVTGPRGSGKTSLLMALISEVQKRNRIIVIEDTPEIPVKELKEAGHHVQHIKTKPLLGEGSFEKEAQEALRTALRLGESVLVIGEVRGPEAKSLFEAMRIGAAGNVVMGTIHGSSAYDTWDRIVNDLGVPSTSFKATDVVVSVASLEGEKGLDRKVIDVTEVKKHWTKNPLEESGFSNLMERSEKGLELKDLKDSELVKRISKKKRKPVNQVIREIKDRVKMKKMILDNFKKTSNEKLLEVGLNSLLTNLMRDKERKNKEVTYFKKRMDEIILNEK